MSAAIASPEEFGCHGVCDLELVVPIRHLHRVVGLFIVFTVPSRSLFVCYLLDEWTQGLRAQAVLIEYRILIFAVSSG